MTDSNRTILHVDMDAFYAAVEKLDYPELEGKPVIVGGLSNRGVVCTASYEARKFGVHSAMATRIARRQCPDGVFLKPRMSRYGELSQQIFEIFRQVSPLVEKVSIDEAYIDITEQAASADETISISRKLKADVNEQLGLTVSVGIAPCKFLAKIASDMDKPDGLVQILPEEVEGFLAPLDVSKIPGVGKVTQSKLRKLGIRTIKQLSQASLVTLRRNFGKFGPRLYDFSRGVDPRKVVTERKAKSLGSENTFEVDQTDFGSIRKALRPHAKEVERRLEKTNLAAKTVTLKIRYGDFKSITRSQSLEVAVHTAEDLWQVAVSLLHKTEAGKRPVRLVGLYSSSLEPRETAEEADFFGMQMND